MGLHEETYCGICGEQIGFPCSWQLKDGGLCKSCAAKLSPRFLGLRSSTVEEIRDHLIYRAENAVALESFHADMVFGDAEKIYLDRRSKTMLAASSPDFRKENPDIIHASQIVSFASNIDGGEEELFFTDKDGIKQRFAPPRHRHSYAFSVTFKIDSPWFDEISVDLNPDSRPESTQDDLYIEWTMQISELFSQIREWQYRPRPEDVQTGPIPGYIEALYRRQPPIGMKPVMPQHEETHAKKEPLPASSWQCPACGAVNAGKFCTECGTPRPTENG